jgi:hypothetical protein
MDFQFTPIEWMHEWFFLLVQMQKRFDTLYHDDNRYVRYFAQ